MDLAMQREMADFGVRIVRAELLNGPINDDVCIALILLVLNK